MNSNFSCPCGFSYYGESSSVEQTMADHRCPEKQPGFWSNMDFEDVFFLCLIALPWVVGLVSVLKADK